MFCVLTAFFWFVFCQNSSVATTNDATAASETPSIVSASTGVSAEAVQSALENSSAQADNEVSQINQFKPKEPIMPLDLNVQANAQVCIFVEVLNV